jgi:hypothetical protein
MGFLSSIYFWQTNQEVSRLWAEKALSMGFRPPRGGDYASSLAAADAASSIVHYETNAANLSMNNNNGNQSSDGSESGSARSQGGLKRMLFGRLFFRRKKYTLRSPLADSSKAFFRCCSCYCCRCRRWS